MPEPATGHDIFIGYASEDREKAQRLAGALEAQGWTVWWDVRVPAGKMFDKVIEEAVKAAKCVVVLWSERSINSRWVLTEAEEGANRGILVPVLLERVEIPFAFGRIQAADLSDWDGSELAPQFLQFVEDISQILGRTPAREAQARRRAEEHQRAAAEAKRKAEEDKRKAAAKAEAKRKAGAAHRRWPQMDRTSSEEPISSPPRIGLVEGTTPPETVSEQPPKYFKWKWPLAAVLVIVSLAGITWLVNKAALSVNEEEVETASSTPSAESDRIAELGAAAREALAAEDFERAASQVNEALKLRPEDVELVVLSNEIETARLAAEDQARRVAEVARLKAMAEEQSESGDHERAVASIEAALELAPRDPDLKIAHAELIKARRVALERQETGEQLGKLSKEARARLAAGDLEGAEALVSEALSLAPEEEELVALREEVADQHRVALEQRRIAEKISRLVDMARAQQETGNPLAGVEKIDLALALSPDDQGLMKLREEMEAQHHQAEVERSLQLGPQQKQALQEALTALGFDTRGIDEIFGPSTRHAISAWQLSRDLPKTGYLDGRQYQELMSEADKRMADDIGGDSITSSSDLPLSTGAPSYTRIVKSGPEAGANGGDYQFTQGEVATIQGYLIAVGLLEGTPDGRYDPVTRLAVARYQEFLGVTADGRITQQQFVDLGKLAEKERERKRAIEYCGANSWDRSWSDCEARYSRSFSLPNVGVIGELPP